MSVCLNHPDTEAVARCVTCGKPLCAKCVVGGKYCSQNCQTAGVAGAMRAGEVVNERKRTNSKAAGKAFLFFIIIVIAAVCAYFYYKANKSKIDNTLKSTAAKVENTTKKVVKDGQEATSRDSRYKRTRERLVK